jgi:hypothetical protein
LKKFTFLAYASFFLICFYPARAQKISRQNPADQFSRCGTMERLEKYFQLNPQARAQAEQNQRMISNGPNINARTYRTTAIITVPVVVHVVIPNPTIVTDADVQWVINKMNEDYAGVNADSTNESPAFMAVRGHSQIRFCLASRTPSGALTNGIDRVASNTQSNIGLPVDPIKRTSSGGADVWDPTSYLNIWTGGDASGFGLLGYAQFPGAGLPADDGIFVNYQGFTNNPCYTISIYNMGRTAVHEVGHYFGLFHNWGDENACTGDDFRQLPGTCLLPTGLFNPPGQGNTGTDIGDTPNQAASTTNCPVGVTTDVCATVAPGKMYQDYMDYTADACYSMFTNVQVARMQWVLDNCRASLKTSLGCSPPVGAASLDAVALQSVNPGGAELSGCTLISYPSVLTCGGSISPKFRIKNNGTSTINTLTIGYIYDNGAPVTQNINLALISSATAVVGFASSVPVTPGSHTFKFFTSNPNGSADQNTANDTTSVAFTVAGGTNLPIIEGFESTTFPPPPLTINNPNGNFTWVRRTPGKNSLAGAFIDNYNNSGPGEIDEIRTPGLITGGTDSVIITFDVAHKNYPGSFDVLSVLVSNDCGTTFTTVYSKSGPTLATAGSSGSDYTSPVATDWRSERIAVGGALIASGQIIVAFRNTNDYGNNIWLDNINISTKVDRDLTISNIVRPAANECSTNIVPQVTVKNVGAVSITAFKVGYSIDGGPNVITSFTQTINPGGSATVTLPLATTTVGTRTFRAFTADPVSAAGTGDQNTSNDTLAKSFVVNTIFKSPVKVDFETAQFPPANWILNNPNNDNTWVRANPGSNSLWSAFIDNYNPYPPGAIDELKSPAVNVTGADSVIFSFDLAHKYYPGANDTLTILVSTDCGATFTSIFKKWGANLATAGASLPPYTTPVQTDWKNQRIAIGGAFLSAGNVIFLIRNTYGFGNNIFIDNINIDALFRRDISIVSIDQPKGVICSTNFTPSVTIQNKGIENVTAFNVSYSIDGGALSTTNVTGVNIPRGGTTSVTLNAGTATLGSHIFKVYSWAPVSISGVGDMNTGNDTLSKAFSLVGSVPAPLTEGFESTTFPPVNWAVVNPDGNITWQRSDNASTGTGSAYVNTYNYVTLGASDELYTPTITYAGVDSVLFSFDVAAATYSYPGSTAIPLDTLEVLVTTDCGNTFTSIYKKWGEDLQTVNDPNTPQTTEFFPAANQWRRENIDLSAFAPNGPIQLVFHTTSNFENNIYIDNVNVSTKTLPARLKSDGYLILPNPFHNQFAVWHYRPPTNLRFITVYNASGQLVWSKQFSGNADRYLTIDLSNRSAGIYIVNLGYDDSNRNVSQRIMKY